MLALTKQSLSHAGVAAGPAHRLPSAWRQAEAVGSFRTWRANTRPGSPPDREHRSASRTRPCPTPRPRPSQADVDGGGQNPAGRASRPIEPRWRALAGSAPPVGCKVEVVGPGGAWHTRRGGHPAHSGPPRRVFVCQVLNGSTASALRLRSRHADTRRRWTIRRKRMLLLRERQAPPRGVERPQLLRRPAAPAAPAAPPSAPCPGRCAARCPSAGWRVAA